MSESKELSPVRIDALREIGNIGMGNALTALSQLQCLFLTNPALIPWLTF